MKHLTIFATHEIDDLMLKQQPENLTKESSIMELFTDFNKVPPRIIEEDCLAIQIREVMKKEHVRMKIVVDADNHFKGILPLDCLTDEKINQKIINESFTKENLYVRNCMVQKSEIQALDFKEIQTATIADVLEALKNIGHKHCLVIDHENNHIRGLLSANDIARALKTKVISTSVGSSFIDVFKALYH